MFSEDIAYLPERRGNREDAELDLTKMRHLGWHAKQICRIIFTI